MLSRERPLARAARPAFGYVRGRRDVDCRGFPESARPGQLCPRPSMRTFHVKHCQRRAAGVPGQGLFRATGLPRMSPPAYASPRSASRTVGFGSRAKPGQLYSEPTAMPSWGYDAVVGVVASSEQERGLCPLPPTGVSRETSLADARPPRRRGKRRSTLLLLDCPPWSGPKFPDSDTQGIGQLRCFEQRSPVVHAE